MAQKPLGKTNPGYLPPPNDEEHLSDATFPEEANNEHDDADTVVLQEHHQPSSISFPRLLCVGQDRMEDFNVEALNSLGSQRDEVFGIYWAKLHQGPRIYDRGASTSVTRMAGLTVSAPSACFTLPHAAIAPPPRGSEHRRSIYSYIGNGDWESGPYMHGSL